jgi:hypothetical protein
VLAGKRTARKPVAIRRRFAHKADFARGTGVARVKSPTPKTKF